MFIILMLFNNVQGIYLISILKRLKCFDLPKFPKPYGKLTENMSSEKEENRSQYIGLAKSLFRLFHTV